MHASDSYLLAKAFHCYKGPDKDRQFIDRRGRNWAEARLCGSSLFIPVGPMLGMLEVEPFRQTLLCTATDRKDFYHQLAVSQSKAASNALGPALPRTLFESTAAFAAASLSQGRRAGLTREQRGDCLKEVPQIHPPLTRTITWSVSRLLLRGITLELRLPRVLTATFWRRVGCWIWVLDCVPISLLGVIGRPRVL